MNKKTAAILLVVSLFLAGLFFSYRLTETPEGLTVDEASIGYNAVLLSQNLKDETGRFLPFFPLTINGADWKQPVTAYSTALVFKIFGPSLTSLRMVSVVAGLVSFALVVYFSYLLLGLSGSIVAGTLFLTSPMVLMHTHLAQENIMPIPFTLIWLIGVYLFTKKSNPLFLILSGISLGLGLYSYKGMRAIVPVWAIVTTLFIIQSSLKGIKKKDILITAKNCLYFFVGILPFIVIMPWLNTHYAGAVYVANSLEIKNFYDFVYPYLSSFDLSALFIKGDSTAWHSTGKHGVFLLSTLPLFLAGLVAATRKSKYWVFLLVSFAITPLLFGQVGSIYRFSRLLVFVPFVVLFSTLGLKAISQTKVGKISLAIIAILFVINFQDFVNYYWYKYPKTEQASFLKNSEESFKKLASIAKENNLKPYIYVDNFEGEGEVGKFYQAAYFPEGLSLWKPGDTLPNESILMAALKSQPDLKQVGEPIKDYYFFTER